MPVITFIVQRIALGVLAAMTFLGLITEETYFATESSFIIPQERKVAIVESLADPDTIIVFEDLEADSPLEIVPVVKEKPRSSSPGDYLKKEIADILTFDIPEKPVDIFVLPDDFLAEEAQTQGVTIPEDLTDRPIPEEVFQQEQKESIQKNLDLIEERLNQIKIEQQKPVVEQPATPKPAETPQQITIPNTLANAVVNIVCLERDGNTLSIAVGSGVIISDQGTIITNGHVAQHILKQESEFVDCEVKHPQNPTMRYRVAVVHIPEMWRGGGLLSESHGTGEGDFAFLNVVGPAPEGILPQSFPFVPIQTNKKALVVGNNILLSGYPAKQTGNIDIDTNVPLIRDESAIADVFTFSGNSIDVVSSGVSPVARQGSSGGAVIDNGSLIGIIVTTNTAETGGTYLNGLTLNYIQRELNSHGLSLESFI